MPDIKVEPKEVSKIARELALQNFIFKFATQYTQKHDSIAPAKVFELSEKNYEDFVNFVNHENFDYKTNSEESLHKLIETAKKEKYFDIASSEFEALKSKITHDKTRDFDFFKEEIKFMLEEEIISRYFYQSGRIELALRENHLVKKAIEILSEPELKIYTGLLNGSYDADSDEK